MSSLEIEPARKDAQELRLNRVISRISVRRRSMKKFVGTSNKLIYFFQETRPLCGRKLGDTVFHSQSSLSARQSL